MPEQSWPKFIRKWTSWLTQDGKGIRPRFRPSLSTLEERTVLSFGGWVSVAGGDVNADGYADIVTGAGIGGGPHVRVLNGKDGTDLHSFFAYSPEFTGGVYVGVGDVNGDGSRDIVTGAGPGGGPHVRIFDGRTGKDLASFFASAPTNTSGVTIAVADINKDGFADIITATASQVRVFSGKDQSELLSFAAYSSDFTGSVYLAAGDVTGDGVPDVVTGAGEGGGPHVRVFDGKTGQLSSEWFAYDPDFRGGVRVAVSDITGDGRNDVITTPGFGGGPHIRVFDAVKRRAVVELMGFSEPFRGGIHVASTDLDADGRGDLIVAEGLGGRAEVRMYYSSNGFTERGRFIAYDPAQSPNGFSEFVGTPIVPPVISPPEVPPTVPTIPVVPPVVPPIVPPVTPPTPPTALDDEVNTAFGSQQLISVLANDASSKGGVLRVDSVSRPQNGTTQIVGSQILYTPNIGFSGTDTFVYTISDGQSGTATAQVRVIVGAPPIVPPTNRPPQANPDAAMTAFNIPVAVTVLTNDVDSDGDPISISGVGAPTNGTANLSQSIIIYTPNTGFSGTDTFSYTIDDGRGGTAIGVVTVTVEQPPPSPPPVVPVVSTADFAGATNFLYTGTNAVQTGVTSSTINPIRAAVIRGRVVDRAMQPLVGVAVSILDHPEFGQTTTQTDGWFSMAVNGGGMLTVNYSKVGFLPSQRQVNVPWRDYEIADEVALIPLDKRVTTIDLTSVSTPIQTTQGNVVTDEDGTRQATILFPQGVTATMKLPNGTTQPLTTLNVRATEYTVGESGPAAMPGTLPPASGYTYAVELSVDEAIAAGATEVTFSQPVPFYVENFLNFPVGMAVPAGYYDRVRGLWVASDNGRVVRVVSEAGGVAALDIDGDGKADSGTALTALGVTSAELVEIARIYDPGTGLWRVPVPHFTPWDYNWPYGPPPGAKGSDATSKEMKQDGVEDPLGCIKGSVIAAENQTLGEVVAVAGVPFSLNYSSDRAAGYSANRTLSIPLTRQTYPTDLKRVELTIEIAGHQFEQSFTPSPNLAAKFAWDGLDAFGRLLQKATPASVKIGYVYDGIYQSPAAFAQSFGQTSGVSITGNRTRQEITLTQSLTRNLGTDDAREAGFGGWTVSVQNSYDPVGQTLHLGTGQTRTVSSINVGISTVAGNDDVGFDGDDKPATQAALSTPEDVAVGPDGSLYIADTNAHRVRRVGPDGVITTVAGSGTQGFSGDDGRATQAELSRPYGVIIGPDGSLYIADTGNRRVRRVGSDGVITTVAGSGSSAFSGDGGPATQAGVFPESVAVGPDGSLYIADGSRVRRVGSNGVITTVAGNDAYGFSGDNGPASRATFDGVSDIAVALDGSLYIADTGNSRVRRVGPNGVITTVAGGGNQSADGELATRTSLFLPSNIDVGLDGSLYIAEPLRVRRVGLDGVISTVAGSGRFGSAGDGGSAVLAGFNGISGVAVGRGDSLYIIDVIHPEDFFENGRIRRVTPALPGFSDTDIAIPSEDGSQLFRFNSTGRHLQTFDALTGTPIYTFGYDAAGRLISVTDADNDKTTIERSAAGTATAIVGPDGHRTTLTVNAEGHLSRVTNPAGESHTIVYGSGGLLTSFTDPLGNTSTITYDSLGRLIKDQDPVNGFTELSRENLGGGSYRVTTTNAVGGTRSYGVEFLPDGSTRRTAVDGRGFITTTLIGTDGSRKVTLPDGTITTTIYDPDPRFGMLSPVVTSQTVVTPSGLTSTTSGSRAATFAVANDPTSALRTLTDTATVNGKTFLSVYDATARTVTTTSAEGRTTVTTSDEKGRIIKAAVPGLLPTTYAYDSRGRMITVTQGTRTVTYAYDPQGNLASITDPLNRSTQLAYDTVGRITRQTQPDGSVITFRYNPDGSMVGLTPPGQPEHTFAYDSRDLLTSSTAPDIGPGDETTRYVYNLAKQLVQENLPGGSTIQYAYCDCGRLTSITAPWGNYAYTYSDTTGQLTSLAGPGGFTLTPGYDGILATSETTSGPVAGRTSWTYDNNFRVVSESVNGTNPVTFDYDGDGLLTRAGNLTISRDTTNGRMTGTSLGTVTDTVSYDPYGDRSGYQARIGTTKALEYTQARDTLGRITQRIETKNGGTTTTDYGYDLNGQLTTVTENGVLVQTYAYDSNGNRLSLTTPSGTVAGSYDDQDRLITYGTKSYTYTEDGYLSSVTDSATGQTTRYTYDGFGNLTRVQLPDGRDITYLIDVDNRRVGKKVNGVLTQGLLYNGQLTPVAELDAGGNVVTRFVYSTGVNVPTYMVRGGVTYRLVTDDLGSVRLVVNTATGDVAQRLEYDAFGRVVQDTNPGFQPFGYAGGLYDADTGLVRFGARDYDAVTGRWTAKDVLSFIGSDTNLSRYSANSPLALTDPTGYIPGGSSSNPLRFKGPVDVAISDVELLIRNNAKGIAERGYNNHLKKTNEAIGGLSKLLRKKAIDDTVARQLQSTLKTQLIEKGAVSSGLLKLLGRLAIPLDVLMNPNTTADTEGWTEAELLERAMNQRRRDLCGL